MDLLKYLTCMKNLFDIIWVTTYIMVQVILNQIEPLTEQQILGICGLQQSTQEAEEALSQGLEALNQSLSDTITSDSLSCPPNMANYMGQMAMAVNKLSTLEGFVRQVCVIVKLFHNQLISALFFLWLYSCIHYLWLSCMHVDKVVVYGPSDMVPPQW